MNKLEIKEVKEELTCWMIGKTLVGEHDFRYNGVFSNSYSTEEYPIYFLEELRLDQHNLTLEQVRENYYRRDKKKEGFIEHDISRNQFIVFLTEKDARLFRYRLQIESIEREEDWKNYSVLPEKARDHIGYRQTFHLIECKIPVGSKYIQIDKKLIFPEHIQFKCLHTYNYIVEDENETIKERIRRMINQEKDKLKREFREEWEKELQEKANEDN